MHARHLVTRALRHVARASGYLMDFNPRAAVELLEGLVAAGDSLGTFRIGEGTCGAVTCGSWPRLTRTLSAIESHATQCPSHACAIHRDDQRLPDNACASELPRGCDNPNRGASGLEQCGQKRFLAVEFRRNRQMRQRVVRVVAG